MHDLSDWNRLDAAAFRVSVKRSVRRLAGFTAVIGAFVMCCGLATGVTPLVVVGLVLGTAGVWNLSRTSVTGLVVEGVALILSGSFLCLAWLWIEDGRPSSVGKSIVAGLAQIVWGIRRLGFYRTARFAPDDAQAIASLEAVVRDLSSRQAKADAAVAEFSTGRFRKRRNRLGLYSEGAVALLKGQVVRLEKRGDIWIESSGTTSLGRSIKVRIQMGDLQLLGRMAAEHFERFERWKLGTSQTRPIAA